MSKEFPDVIYVSDFSGRERAFELSVCKLSIGYLVKAKEKETGGHYAFQAFSAHSPYHVLGLLNQKIKRRLSIRYLERESGKLGFSHDEAKGHIAMDGVVVDGQHIPFEKLSEMLQVYEGFLFELKIRNLSDE